MFSTKSVVLYLALFLIVISWIGPYLFPIDGRNFENLSRELGTNFTRLLLLNKIAGILTIFSIIAVLYLYIRQAKLSKHVETKEAVRRIKEITKTLYLCLIAAIVLSLITLFIHIAILLNANDFVFNYHIVSTTGIGLICLYLLLSERATIKYFCKNDSRKIISDHFVKQHHNLVQNGNTEQAYISLAKACEYTPNNIELLSQLALFCEIAKKDNQQANTHLDKAKSLLKTEKYENEQLASYEYNLGNILYKRGQKSEGLEHIKKSIELQENPHRRRVYEEILSEVT